jgi:metal-responsive CopG/Arc/MetJ family transcriptional regulator
MQKSQCILYSNTSTSLMKTNCIHSIQIGLSIPQILVDKIDLLRGDVTRSRFIWRMVETPLNQKELASLVESGIATPDSTKEQTIQLLRSESHDRSR